MTLWDWPNQQVVRDDRSGPGIDTGPPALPPLAVVSTTPDSRVLAPTADVTLRVHGSGFTAQSVIWFAGVAEPTTFVSSSEVTTGLNGAVFTGVDPAVAVYVREGVFSNAVYFRFYDPVADNAVLTAVTPTTIPRGQDITLTGSGFTMGHTVYTGSVQQGGIALPTFFDSSTQLRAAIPASVPLGAAAVSVIHGGPPIGCSVAKAITVTAALP